MSSSVEEFVEYVVKAIVDHPDNVKIKVVEGAHSTILELSVNPEDIAKVIGRGGRIARSIRTLLGVLAAKQQKRVLLEILE